MRAARAAFELRTALAELNEELERDLGVTLQIRVGVNTGKVLAGSPAVGSALVLGDAVNVAARLEQAAAPTKCCSAARLGGWSETRSRSSRSGRWRSRAKPTQWWRGGFRR